MTTTSYAGPSVFGYETDHLRRVAAISVHTSPLATLGGKDAGGMNVYVRELSCHTAQLGLPVDIFTRRTDPHSPEVVEICEGVNLVYVDAGPPEPVDKNQLFELLPEFAENMALYSLRAGVRYDVVHAHYWLSGWTAHLLKRYWNTPFSLMFHTTAHMKNIVSPESEQETSLRGEIEGKLVGLADSIIAANPDEAADLIWRQRGNSARICTIPPGVDTELFQPLNRAACRMELGIPQDEQMVLFVGRIDPIKGLDTLLGATKLPQGFGFFRTDACRRRRNRRVRTASRPAGGALQQKRVISTSSTNLSSGVLSRRIGCRSSTRRRMWFPCPHATSRSAWLPSKPWQPVRRWLHRARGD